MDLTIREERSEDYHASELVAQRAFWNKHHPGCSEHYLVHKLRDDESYIPELTRVAVCSGDIVGLIMYARAKLLLTDSSVDVLTFGPLCVETAYQRMGIGGMLLESTLKAAADMGHRGVVIFGEPDYYPLHGFSTCDKWGITTLDGKNFPAFLGRELVSGALSLPGARFEEPVVYNDLPTDAVEEYSKLFPYMQKLRLSTQWPD